MKQSPRSIANLIADLLELDPGHDRTKVVNAICLALVHKNERESRNAIKQAG